MQVGKAWIGDRLHLRCRVQLHRAGTERDHPAIERQVPIRQRPQIAEHRRLAVMGVENGMGEVGGRTLAPSQVVVERPHVALGDAERRAHRVQLGGGGVLAD